MLKDTPVYPKKTQGQGARRYYISYYMCINYRKTIIELNHEASHFSFHIIYLFLNSIYCDNLCSSFWVILFTYTENNTLHMLM